MNEITVTIDGKECKTQEGEFILNVARENDIFIPAICYLTRCSPTLACRICLVQADGKNAYACNAKAKDGMEVITSTEEIEAERRAIMEVYDVNHPLECGVCDQSGECELQNYTLEMKIDSQNYAIKDTHKPTQDWGLMHYDPSLCIMCERCVTSCKDMIGDTALKTVPRGSEKLPAELKEEMPKDAYAMWNKLNKSLIGSAISSETNNLDCTNCGECIAVCPVGAIVGTDFQYTSNAWELTKIPSACSHCSSACHLEYEVKHTSIENSDNKIYRVKNEFHYSSLCGAGRFGFDYQNQSDATKDADKLAEAVEKFKSAKNVVIDGVITNEEALILQNLKNKLGFNLVANDETLIFDKFVKAYEKVAKKPFTNGTTETIHSSDFVISVGTALKTDNPAVRYAFNNSMKINKGAGLYFHPVVDPVINGLGKNIAQINHQPHQELKVLYFIISLFATEEKMPKEILDYAKSLDYADLNLPDKFDANLTKFLKKKEKFSLIVGQDFYGSDEAEKLAYLVAIIEKHTDFEVLVISPNTNSLGVSLICDLNENLTDGLTIGYNIKKSDNLNIDYEISAFGDGDFNIPALNQQEGTFTNIDKRVVPLNSALSFNGYNLNDIANEVLNLDVENTIDYTKYLPTDKGYKNIAFDDLENYFTNAQEEKRGYILDINSEFSDEVISFSDSNKIKETKLDANLKVIYLANPINQFNGFTHKTEQLAKLDREQLNNHGGLYLSPAFAKELGVSNGDKVKITKANNNLELQVIIDNKIDGEISYLPTFDNSVSYKTIFDKDYRFTQVKITKLN
jgi:NADH-quinone oxidoreductase subunit G